jgi:hypothetical protein
VRTDRRGMVLPLTLLALVVIAAVVACAFASAYLEQRIGRNTLYAAQAAGAAEAGAAAVIGAWEENGLSLLAPGESTVLPGEALPGSSAYTSFVRRLNGQLFLLEVEGIRADAGGGPLARRRIGVVLRSMDSVAAGLPPVSPLAQRAWIATPF